MFLFKRGSIYYLDYLSEAEGKIKRVSTKKKTKTEANLFLQSFKEKLTEGSKKKSISIADFRAEYLNHIKDKLSPNYYRIIEISFKQFIDYSGDVNLRNISITISDKFISNTFKRTKEGARTYFIALRSAFNKAMEWNYIESNPFSKIRLPKLPERENLFISPEQFDIIINNESDAILTDIYTFGYNTGMRIGEITNCRLSWINLFDRVITVKNEETFTTKSRKVRTVPINDKVYEVVIKYLPQIIKIGDDRCLFNKNGFKLNTDYISKKFKTAVRKSYGKDCKYHFHNLRGSFGSELIRKGVSAFYVMKLLGHSSLSVTEKNYLSLQIDDLKKAVNLLD
ncbi:MAG: tyrosine-type recombinase/integrase [bacterium]